MRGVPSLAILALTTVAVAACGGDDDTAVSSVTSAVTTHVVGTAVPPTAAPATTAPTTAPVTAPSSSNPPSTVAPATAEPGGAYDFSAVEPIVQAFVDERGLAGAGLVVVERDDGVVHEEYWGEFGPDRVSLVASSSKMVTAGVLLHLHDDGLLDIDRPIAEYLDWGRGNPDVTVAQLLSNSSGLVGLLPTPGYGPYVCQFRTAGTVQACAEEIFTTSADDSDVIAPDTQFRYGGGQWQVAGGVAEAVTGTPWAQLVDEIYAEPCGLETLGYNNHFTQIGTTGFDYPQAFDGDPSVLAPTDNPNMEAGMYTAPADYAALLLMHLRGGRCDGGQVLSQASLDRMHTDRIGSEYGGVAPPWSGYGMGWWVDDATGRIVDPGAYGSLPWLDLDGGFGAYLVVEADGGTGGELAGLLYDEVERAILAGRG